MSCLLARERSMAGANDPKDDVSKFLINSCHIWREGGEWARQLHADPDGTVGSRQAPVPIES